MAFLSATDKQHIADAIRAVEARTKGEFVCVIASTSHDYRFIPLLWASVLALCVPAIVWLSGLWWTQGEVYLAQVAVFLLAVVAFNWTPVKMLIVSRATQRRHAARLAREQFFAQRLHRTREFTGMLLFVSVAEHYVEVLADDGVNAKVAPGTWENIVANFVSQVKARRIARGFVDTVNACGNILAEYFPPDTDNPNELPNRLIEI